MTAVKSKGMLFSAPMVLALLAGRKSVTRRIVKPQPPKGLDYWLFDDYEREFLWLDDPREAIRTHVAKCPYPIGTIISRWASRINRVITSVRVERVQDITEADAIAEGLEIQMGDGTGPGPGNKWNGPGYWDGFSRGYWGKTYHVTGPHGYCYCDKGRAAKVTPAVCAYMHLWNSINGKTPGACWGDNPWVWVYTLGGEK